MPLAMREGERSFAVPKSSFDPEQGQKEGRIIHTDPGIAAKKAARVLFRRFPDAGDVVDVKLVEKSKDRDTDAPRNWYYRITRVKLAEPRQLRFGGPEADAAAAVDARYSYVVRKLKHSPF